MINRAERRWAFSPGLISQGSPLPTIMISWSDQCPIDRGIPDHHIENLKIWLSRDRMSGSRTQSAGPRSIVVSRRTNIRTAAECRQAAGRGGRLAPVCSRSGAIPPVGTGLIQRTSWQAGTGAIPIWLALVRVVGGHKAAASIVTPPMMPSRVHIQSSPCCGGVLAD